MTGGELNATQIRALLHEPGRRLQAAGAHGDIKLVGAAALILQGIGNRPTADIDPSYADPDTIHAVVADMATDDDLAPDWLNTNAAAFVPDNATWIPLEQLDGLTIQAADTETLLAMKIAAERDKDTLDIARLLHRLRSQQNANKILDDDRELRTPKFRTKRILDRASLQPYVYCNRSQQPISLLVNATDLKGETR